MMHISPSKLQEVCINYICDNLFALCEPLPSSTKSLEVDNRNVVPQESDILKFIDGETYFHSEISEELLRTLCLKGKLTDYTLSLFDIETTRLKQVSIPNASNLSRKGLRVLKGHKIIGLEICNLKIPIDELISCLGEWTLQHLRTLCVARSTLSSGSRRSVMFSLSKLKCLQALDVSGTEFNRHALEIVVEELPHLESIDISSTRIDDISPLLKAKLRLKQLSMYNLKYIKSCDEVLTELSELRCLDVSEEKDGYAFELFGGSSAKVHFLSSPQALPHLTSLDISGKGEIQRKELQLFLENHKRLRYLGLVHCEICSEECFVNPKHPDFNPQLQIGGVATEEQILTSLCRYSRRPLYVQKCLYNLFRLTQSYTSPRVDIIQLVLSSMELHPEAFGIQMAATACLYILTKGELGAKLHPSLLSRVVGLCLVAMSKFPTHYQLQKNSLLTLCSDRILQDVPIDRFKCAKLVLDSLHTFEDPSMNRMSVAICSILAAKISTSETSLLGSQPKYMHKLLRLVRAKKDAKSVDITMKFTLSALWNLTDESPTTCSVFLEQGGLELFLEVLQTFPGEATVETKVLGLINNIAEVPSLRSCLLQITFISVLRSLLHSSQIDVSYFAAGIMAHLAGEGARAWERFDSLRSLILEELGQVVIGWEPPEGEMVAYRSFYPFISLLNCRDAPQVQLWAVWAIHHVCTKNPGRYCPMLEAEDCSKIVHQMWADSSLNPTVRSIAEQIRNLLKLHGNKEMLPHQPIFR